MNNEENDDCWSEESENPKDRKKNSLAKLHKMVSHMEKLAKQHVKYMVDEGFIEPTEDPSVYQYTAEGVVLIQQRYKQMVDDGLI